MKEAKEGANLSLSGNGSYPARLPALECVDHATFPDVWVPYKPDGYLLLVRVEPGELSQELDQGALPEAMVGRGVESNSGVSRCQVLDVTSLGTNPVRRELGRKRRGIVHGDPVRDKIALVDDQNDLFVGFLFPDVLQNGFAHRSHRIPRVEDVEDDI